ncbi:uncharacterized protein J3R85_003971 [Psidium guajava]|nr:uncharacterized protein J3R85_003971 [Psidium guajava]
MLYRTIVVTTIVICAERKRSSGSVVPNNNKWLIPRNKEKCYASISTRLALYEDPWKRSRRSQCIATSGACFGACFRQAA